MSRLNVKAFAGLANLVVILGASLFLPAWTVRYWQAWVFLGVFGTSVLAITVRLMRSDPALLERRTSAGPIAEKERLQRVIQSLASVAFVGLFVVSALDHRFGWSAVPPAVSIAGDVAVVFGLWAVDRVFRANTFTSATIEVGAGQRVVDTGPYAVVRHPMYSGAFVMLVGVPFALGSWWSLLCVVPMIAVITARLLDEERFLADKLDGYRAYQATVRWRLVPGLW